MKGLDSFLNLFGDVTLFTVAEIVLSIIFVIMVYKKVKAAIIAHYEKKRKRDEELEEALTAVRLYPKWREQSFEIQHELNDRMRSIEETQKLTIEQLTDMKQTTERRERNKIRDRLLHNHRYYMSKTTNPNHSWTQMEADAFWKLFREYEDNGGDGYMHTDVQPDMESLIITDYHKI